MDIITLILIVVTFIILALGFAVIQSSREKLNRLYFLNILTIIGWSITIIYYRISSVETVFLWTKLLYISATLIASNFLYFAYAFPKYSYSISNAKKILIFAPNILIILLIAFSDSIIVSTQIREFGENVVNFGGLYLLYVLYILFYFNFAFYKLISKLLKTKDETEKVQIKYVLLGYVSSGVISFTTNLILPSFGYFSLNWVGQISTVLMASSATYAIVKHHLFNAKVVITEVLVFALWIILLIRTLISQGLTEFTINGITFVITFLVGILLIKSVIKEVESREEIEKLAEDLKKANNKLLELDKQKSEFVSFASHQLRSPLTAMKGYTSLLLEGEMGELSSEVKEAIHRIFESSKTLTTIVDDYLNISRIELGTMKYAFETIDFKELTESVMGELKPTIEKSKLDFSFSTEPNDPKEKFLIHADKDKFKQIVGNLIDNSMKYTPSGSIKVSLSKNFENRKILLSIKDTGVGIAPEVMPKLFAKFVRATNANKQNIYGTGLGLYVAKEIAKAHKGRIWAESEGEGKGSTFFLEVDMAV